MQREAWKTEAEEKRRSVRDGDDQNGARKKTKRKAKKEME